MHPDRGTELAAAHLQRATLTTRMRCLEEEQGHQHDVLMDLVRIVAALSSSTIACASGPVAPSVIQQKPAIPSDNMVLVTIDSARIAPRLGGVDSWDDQESSDGAVRTVLGLATLLGIVGLPGASTVAALTDLIPPE